MPCLRRMIVGTILPFAFLIEKYEIVYLYLIESLQTKMCSNMNLRLNMKEIPCLKEIPYWNASETGNLGLYRLLLICWMVYLFASLSASLIGLVVKLANEAVMIIQGEQVENLQYFSLVIGKAVGRSLKVVPWRCR